MMSCHESWMHFALDLAVRAEMIDEVPVGAVLVHEDRVLASGFNRRETDRRVVAHAEIMALEQFNRTQHSWRLPEGTSLYVTTEPCLMCTGALLEARVDNIYYGCSDTKGAGLSTVLPLIQQGRFDHRPRQIVGGILEDVTSQALSSFFTRRRAEDASSGSRAEVSLDVPSGVFRHLRELSHSWSV